MITIVRPANLVIKLPYEPLTKAPKISIIPADTSEIATKLASAGDKSNYSDSDYLDVGANICSRDEALSCEIFRP